MLRIDERVGDLITYCLSIGTERGVGSLSIFLLELDTTNIFLKFMHVNDDPDQEQEPIEYGKHTIFHWGTIPVSCHASMSLSTILAKYAHIL